MENTALTLFFPERVSVEKLAQGGKTELLLAVQYPEILAVVRAKNGGQACLLFMSNGLLCGLSFR
jgi:hypothetical protein